MKNTILLRKMGGFYVCFDNDAIVLSYLCNYQIKNSRVGFPINTLDKVLNILDNNSINYIVRSNDEDINKKILGKKNKYNIYLDKGKKKIDLDYRINKILDKINNMKEEEVNNLLKLIEDNIYE